jgi:hypothetical protein
MKTKLTITRKINSYTGKDGWGFNCVEGSDGNIYHVKQEPDSLWKTGDNITEAKKEKEQEKEVKKYEKDNSRISGLPRF